MYLKQIDLQNIKCFEQATLKFPHRHGDYGGWNVILGENGRGKSTILRSIALGVLNPFLALYALEQLEGQFSRRGADGQFRMTTHLVFHAAELRQKRGKATNYRRSLTFSPQGSPDVSLDGSSGLSGEETIPHALCYGYGPFRRLEGARRSVPSPSFQFPQPLSRFVTLFTDEMGLADATRGLIDLYVASVDPKHTAHPAARQTFEAVRVVVDSLLPGGVQLDSVTSEAVQLKTAPGVDLRVMELSDGYRSFLSLVLDLLRHCSARFGRSFLDRIQQEGDRSVVDIEAVVLIDEADAHLHPSWQRELGERLRRVFPKIQFIVTTHSPFVAQGATDGGLFVLRAGENGTVVVDQPVESVRGWTVSQILTSPLFGLESTRDPGTESLIREQAALSTKERAGTLTRPDRERLAGVQRQLSALLSAPGETYDEMQRQQDMAAYVDRTLERFKGSGT